MCGAECACALGCAPLDGNALPRAPIVGLARHSSVACHQNTRIIVRYGRAISMSNDVVSDRQHTAAQKAPAPRWGLPRLWPWALLCPVLLFAAYVLAGFYLVPGLVRSTATNWVRTNLDKPIALGEIKFNPLTFTLDVDDIALPSATMGARTPMVAAAHVRVGFSILSLFRVGLSLQPGHPGPAFHQCHHPSRWLAEPDRTPTPYTFAGAKSGGQDRCPLRP